MQVNDELIRSVVQEVLSHLRNRKPAPSNGKSSRWGVYDDVDSAVTAAAEAQQKFEKRGLEDRRAAVNCIRRICIDQSEPLGREEMHETKIGRLKHKIEKLVVAGERTPGVEFLRTDACSGENGLTVTEYAPFGVIGAVTPMTHSLPTLASNAITMLASGNAVVFNAHPSGAGIARHGGQLFNQSIQQAIGLDNLIAIIDKPTLRSAQASFAHP